MKKKYKLLTGTYRQAFADVLMLYEFLHTFGETLGFDMESLPLLDSLQVHRSRSSCEFSC